MGETDIKPIIAQINKKFMYLDNCMKVKYGAVAGVSNPYEEVRKDPLKEMTLS